MLLNKQSWRLLNSLSQITESIVIQYPVTSMKDNSNSITAFLDLEKLGVENFGSPFALLKLKEFNELTKIVGDDCNIEKDDKGIITVSNNADISCKYYTTALTDTITNAFSVSPKVLENVKSAINICTFELTTQISDKLKKASTLLNFEDMILDITENGLKITTTNKENSSNDFSISITENVNTTANGKVFISIRNLKRLPVANYNVNVKQHPTRADVYVLEFIPKDNDVLTIIIPSKAYKAE